MKRYFCIKTRALCILVACLMLYMVPHVDIAYIQNTTTGMYEGILLQFVLIFVNLLTNYVFLGKMNSPATVNKATKDQLFQKLRETKEWMLETTVKVKTLRGHLRNYNFETKEQTIKQLKVSWIYKTFIKIFQMYIAPPPTISRPYSEFIHCFYFVVFFIIVGSFWSTLMHFQFCVLIFPN